MVQSIFSRFKAAFIKRRASYYSLNQLYLWIVSGLLSLLAVVVVFYGDKISETILSTIILGFALLGVLVSIFWSAGLLGFISTYQHKELLSYLAENSMVGLVLTEGYSEVIYVNRHYSEQLRLFSKWQMTSPYDLLSDIQGSDSFLSTFMFDLDLKGMATVSAKVLGLNTPNPQFIVGNQEQIKLSQNVDLFFELSAKKIDYFFEGATKEFLLWSFSVVPSFKEESNQKILSKIVEDKTASNLIDDGSKNISIGLKSNSNSNNEKVCNVATGLFQGSASQLSVTEDLVIYRTRFERYFNNAPVAIAEIDKNGKINYANTLFIELLPKIETGLLLKDLVKKNQYKIIEDALISVLRVGRTIVDIEVIPKDDKKEVTVRFIMSKIKGSDSESLSKGSVLIYATDISQQKALELQFVQSQKMQAIGQLAGGVAHDFNNVLTAIIGNSDLLLQTLRPNDSSFADVMSIKQNATRAAGLVRQLLAFSRRQTLRPQVLILNDIIVELRSMLSRLLGEKVSLKLDSVRDLWPVKVDAVQFEQVIINLAVNARDAMPNGGDLLIRTSNLEAKDVIHYPYKALELQDYVVCEVCDNGVGIDSEIGDKIFDPFFTTKELGKGTGLGLSTVYGIIKQTGGLIFVETAKNKGTTFLMFLPKHKMSSADVVSNPVLSEKQEYADLTGQGTILLVEDEESVRSFASRALKARGYVVYEAPDGLKALEIVNKLSFPIDMVVSDVMMPEMDGPTLARQLRLINPNIKVILVSGYARDSLLTHIEDEETFTFLPKPFTLKALAAAVKECMEP